MPATQPDNVSQKGVADTTWRSPDGTIVAFMGAEGRLCLWQIDKGFIYLYAD